MRNVLVTGFFGGIEVGLGIMAYLAVLHETGNHLLAGLAFSIGLIALLLAHSELFTENFLMPVAAVVAKEGSVVPAGKALGRDAARRTWPAAGFSSGSSCRPSPNGRPS